MLRSRELILDFSTPPTALPASARARSCPAGMGHHPLDPASPLRRGRLAPGFRILPVILQSKLQSHCSAQLLHKWAGTVNSLCCPATGLECGSQGQTSPWAWCGQDRFRSDAALAFLVRISTEAFTARNQEALPSGPVIYNWPE